MFVKGIDSALPLWWSEMALKNGDKGKKVKTYIYLSLELIWFSCQSILCVSFLVYGILRVQGHWVVIVVWFWCN